MIRDAQTTFSDAQAVTAAAASTNLIDLSVARDIGVGRELWVVLVVTTALTDAGSDSTVTVDIQTDTLAAFGSPTTVQTLFTIPAVSAVGTVLRARINPVTTDEQFMRLNYTPNNGNLTTGSWDAFITTDPDLFTIYPKGYTITNPS